MAQLINESNKEVLILLTSTLYKDLEPNNPQHIICTSLSAVGNIATVDMCRELSG